MLNFNAGEKMNPQSVSLVIFGKDHMIPKISDSDIGWGYQYSILFRTPDLSKGLKKLKELKPDLILVEANQIEEEKTSFLLKLRVSHPEAKILMLVQDYSLMEWFSFLKAGVRGILESGFTLKDLGAAASVVYQGGIFLDSRKREKLVHECAAKVRHMDQRIWDLLTNREIQILKYLAEGHTAKETANLLGLSPKTVDTHKANLMRKVNIHHRTDLIKYALRKKIVSLHDI